MSTIAKLQGFDVDLIINEDYFTKITIDSDVYVSEIVMWKNHNLCEAGVMDVSSDKYLYQVSCEYDEKYPFSDYFSEFFAI